MEFFDTILWPIRWVIEAVLAGSHSVLEAMGMDPASGAAWFFSIMVLVLLVRAALIPVFVRQIKSQRRMMEIAPELKKIQDKYKGKKDQFSRCCFRCQFSLDFSGCSKQQQRAVLGFPL